MSARRIVMSKKNLLKGLLFTTVPDYFLANVMTTLKESELRVMLYIYLHTLGYGKLADSINYDQFLNGIVTKEGKRLDQGAGVSRRSLVTALVALEQKGLISRQSNSGYAAIIQVELPPADNQAKQVEPAKTMEEAKETSQPEEQVQMLPQEVQALPEEVQTTPEKQPVQVQPLHPSWNQNHEIQDHENRVMVEAVNLITERIPGISAKSARKFAKIAFNNNRDIGYIENLVTHVTTSPAIRTPAAVFIALINQNADRTPPARDRGTGSALLMAYYPGKAVQPSATGSKSSYHTATGKGNYDWSKFAPGGKYAYLVSSTSNT